MADVIATVTTAISLAKQLLGLAEQAKDVNARLIIADLQLQLAELKTRLAGIIDENNQLKGEVKQLSSTRAEVTIKDGLYYKPDGDGPFCTACYDAGGKFVRVTEMGEAFHDIARWRCNVCKAHYGGRVTR